ncbi:hypothetical protein SDC9_205227 [bioreactor metagenome]|uniref:Uncharacterized protein n=1 Tax=bioreactor metagenome TaxID=1076179 RepID=A0A645JDA3_9ZZZZ
MWPARHLAHAGHRGIGIKIIQIAFLKRTQQQPVRLDPHHACIDLYIHLFSLLSHVFYEKAAFSSSPYMLIT